MYLFLAFFWLIVGLAVQLFLEDLERIFRVRADRMIVGLIFFVMFSYNFFRWRLARMHRRAMEESKPLAPPPRPRIGERERDPTFDFSDPKPDESDAKKPPV